MAEISKLQKILKQNPVGIRDLQRQSSVWFNKHVQDMVDVKMMRAETLMRGDQNMKTSTITPGYVYMYIYDPKHKDTLPYYDQFPLVIPFAEVDKGFLGLNLHYLPYHYRAALLDKLLTLADLKLTDTNKIKLSWDIVKGFSQFAAAKPCVKHYLYDHVKTPFKRIPSAEWASVVLLPTERFVKATPQQVWADSIKIIRNS
jgi:hypothetical protein